jgi:hypothetical protein
MHLLVYYKDINITFHVAVHRRFPSTETAGKTRQLGMFKYREERNLQK